MKCTRLRRRAPLRAKKQLRRATPLQPTCIDGRQRSPARAVAGRRCIVCGAGADRPAHLIPRSLGGCGDPLCVVPLCRRFDRAYDRGELDLLPYLEPAWRAQLAHAVGHLGLIGALRRVAVPGPCRSARGDDRAVSDARSTGRTGGSLTRHVAPWKLRQASR